jgi:antitoxin component YwqK of YwqJK toxin-antitoxin module
MNKPKIIRGHYKNRNIWYEEYYINGKLHTDGGPAYIWYYDNGDVAYKGYYINDLRHREDGPASIGYDKNGSVKYTEYWLNGKLLTMEEWYSKLTTKQKVSLLYGRGNE